MHVTAIILAAGKGTRMGADTNKVFIKLKEPILYYSVKVFQDMKRISEIIIVGNVNEHEKIKDVTNGFSKVCKIVAGGKTRQESCYNGVNSCRTETDIILIHDGARPFIQEKVISNLIDDALAYGCSVVGVLSKDTIKEVSDGFVVRTLDRAKLWTVQTPQVFKASIIREAHKRAISDGFEGTDDTVLAERIGYKVKITPGYYDNIKITTPDDLEIAKRLLLKLSNPMRD